MAQGGGRREGVRGGARLLGKHRFTLSSAVSWSPEGRSLLVPFTRLLETDVSCQYNLKKSSNRMWQYKLFSNKISDVSGQNISIDFFKKKSIFF